MGGCNICNSLHETNGKYENLNSIKSQLHYHQATYNSCSYVVNFIYEYFMETDLHLQNVTTSSKFETRKLHAIISQLHHITTAKHIKAVGIFSNVSKCMQIWMKRLYIIQIGMKLFEVPRNWKSCLKFPKNE